jgi:hypothetical protein
VAREARGRPAALPRLHAGGAAPGSPQGSVALSLCTTARPRYTRCTNIFGTSVSEATMRPNPTSPAGGGVGHIHSTHNTGTVVL